MEVETFGNIIIITFKFIIIQLIMDLLETNFIIIKKTRSEFSCFDYCIGNYQISIINRIFVAIHIITAKDYCVLSTLFMIINYFNF